MQLRGYTNQLPGGGFIIYQGTPWFQDIPGYIRAGSYQDTGMVLGDNRYSQTYMLAPVAAPAPAPVQAPRQVTTVTVSPTVQTAVSPMISPNFIQTGAGSTGSVGAGTSMSAPTAQQAAANQAADAAAARVAAQQAADAAAAKLAAQQAADAAAAKLAAQQADLSARTTQLDLIAARMAAQAGIPANPPPAFSASAPIPAPVQQASFMPFTPSAPPLPPVSNLPAIVEPVPPVTSMTQAAPLPKQNMGIILAALAAVGLLVMTRKKGK